jgi:hypothetical protein
MSHGHPDDEVACLLSSRLCRRAVKGCRAEGCCGPSSWKSQNLAVKAASTIMDTERVGGLRPRLISPFRFPPSTYPWVLFHKMLQRSTFLLLRVAECPAEYGHDRAVVLAYLYSGLLNGAFGHKPNVRPKSGPKLSCERAEKLSQTFRAEGPSSSGTRSGFPVRAEEALLSNLEPPRGTTDRAA